MGNLKNRETERCHAGRHTQRWDMGGFKGWRRLEARGSRLREIKRDKIRIRSKEFLGMLPTAEADWQRGGGGERRRTLHTYT